MPRKSSSPHTPPPTNRPPRLPNAAISLRGCRQHNLQGFDLEIPLGKLSVVTGPSGSGKSSLAFHTLYAEGQRRYVETFSPYVRQFFDRMDKPAVDRIDGIPPAIAIEQKNNVRTTRSTVGTLTEINDYLKLLFARLGVGHDPHTGEEIRPDSPESAAAWALANLAGQAVLITFPVPIPAATAAADLFPFLNAQGYLRVLIQRRIYRCDEPLPADIKTLTSPVEVIQDRLTLTPEHHSRLLEALEAAFSLGKGSAGIVAADASAPPHATAVPAKIFTNTWTNPRTGFTLRPPTAALFSFNNPLGACPICRGFGRVIGINLDKAVPDPGLSLAAGAIKPFQGERGDECQRDLLRNCKEHRININTPWDELDAATREWIYYGDSKSPALTDLENADELWRSGKWYGVKGFFDWMESKAYKMHVRVFLSRYRSYTTCAACRGKRLQPDALCFKINGLALPELWAMPVANLLVWFHSLGTSPDPTLNLVLTELTSRLTYLSEVGLGYLTLDRATRTLSGGEVERVNLTTCLGASLTGTLFVLDEPTVGLHQRDIHRLVAVMHGLRDKGNTLVVVEHEATVITAADHLIDLGPGAGSAGGQLIYQGPVVAGRTQGGQNGPPSISATDRKSPAASPAPGTLPWLTGENFIAVPSKRRRPTKQVLAIRGATRHNLHKLDADIPLGLFVCLTGVSGSGKSTFARDVVHLNLAKHFGLETDGDPAPLRQLLGAQHLGGVELVDQSPVARTPRSTPAVFLGAFETIRQLFCETDAAKTADLKPGFFSFNSGDGRCDRCAGNGFEKVEMQFLSDLYVACPDCSGCRYKASTLDYLWHEKSIAEALDLTVNDAVAWFAAATATAPPKQIRLIQQTLTSLQPLLAVGLGYLKLGQALNTLSGGEAQRLKLCQLLGAAADPARASARPAKSPGGAAAPATHKLLILDEPTTGLHFSDIANLLGVFQQLVASGHTLLVIEHNLDVIKSADWILDLGPEAGAQGGQLVAQGSPEAVALTDTPTAEYLRQALGMPPIKDHRRPAGVGKQASRLSSSKIQNPLSSAIHDPLSSKIQNPKSKIPPPVPNSISLRGARHHNLKNISLDIPRDRLVVISGLSGSGKSTLAFDILFAEGQRRFLDSMSSYARQFAEQLEKPEFDQLAGLPPTVAIEQRVSQGGGKSTVATVTELWNFIRLLYSKLGTLYCPDCEVPVEKQSLAAIENILRAQLRKGPVSLLAPLIRARKGFHTEVAEWAAKHGFARLLVDGKIQDSASFQRLERFKEHNIDVEVAALAQGSAGTLPADSGVPPKSSSKPSAAQRQSAAAPSNLQSIIQQALTIGKGLIKLRGPDAKLILLSIQSSCPCCNRSFEDLDPRLFSFNSPHGWCLTCRGHGRVPKRRQVLDVSRFDSVLAAELDADRSIERMDDVELVECPDCHGTRLNPTASIVTLKDTPIAALSRLSINHAAAHFESLTFADERSNLIARDILPEIRQRLAFLQEVGLGYLQLDRSGNTLSGGESQRIRLAAQLGSNLRGVLYVLDEPTIGLHPRDNAALLTTLIKLRDQGNSLVIVEHDADTIAAADHLIDLGPGAGRFGGNVVYQGPVLGSAGIRPADSGVPPKPRANNANKIALAASPTLRALAATLSHPLRGTRRPVPKTHPFLTLTGCHAHNLKHIDAAIPLGRLTVLTGISGSGKSTLMHSCLAVAAAAATANRSAKPAKSAAFSSAAGFDKIKACFEVDQSPIGKTSRSCPATYVKVLDHIRALFAQLPEARMRGFDASRFSFNTEGGRCPDCKGNGRIKLEMDFLPSTWVHCETCNGDRFNPATLEVTFRHKNMGQVLAMSIDEAAAFFDSQPRIAAPLKLMADTGLGYLQLGQPSPTLSGGEAQRIKLVSELTKGRSVKSQLASLTIQIKNLYLIEEPTVGLHQEDVQRLIDVLHRLVDEGHTVVVIEHHMAIAAEADWILDLGPEAGERGGKIVAHGPPEKILASKTSRTARFLRSALGR
ncbi:MAG: excinuclease ABC subunit UvrA [Verrucomicrobiota bacterium]